MKKLNRLFAILIAVLGAGSLSAQRWTQSGEYYLYNESSKTFLSRGASWGTQAITDRYGIPFYWDSAAGSIRFLDSDAHLFITNDGHCFTDNASTGWTFVTVNESTCRLMGTENRFLKQETDGVLTLTTTASEAVVWTFKTPEERNAIVERYPTENYAAIINATGLSVDASDFIDILYGSNYARKDMTSSIGTAKFSGNAGSWAWTEIRHQDWQPAYGTNYAEVYQATGAYSQRISNLPSGIYKLTVSGFHRQGGWEKCNDLNNRGYQLSTATLMGNDQAIALKPWVTERTGEKNPDNTGEAVAAFNAGKYNNEVYVYVAEDGILDISVNIKNHLGGAWVLFNNFTLTYFSDQVNSEDASNILTLAEAVSGTMPDDVVQKLATAKNAFESNQTIANYNALTEAIETANNYTEWYAPLQKEIEKAEALGFDVATYKANVKSGAYKNKAESLLAVETLMAEEYAYIENTFLYDVTLSDSWNSKGTNTQAATFDKEHWSGEVRKYKNQNDENGQGWNASAWSIDFDQSVTLPAGEYVFKVAGRKSDEATLELTVTMGETVLGSVNDFPSSNNAKGINKAGATSFDANDPEGFANNGNGFGWQWRYVKFTLATESTVKVAVHAEANALHQWVSFGDYTLHMDESAYLETNKDGLIAPMAAAQALVGVKPMGKNEATALHTAIDMSVTTGAELKAKIEALKTAVANANAWVLTYNNAKAPLVAALERFEEDYNNAEHGALDYMCNTRWATAISMAQEAAVTKDVTDSYEGFEMAAKNLNDALDAATTSIGEYDNLKAAIENAEEPSGDDWGSEPFQKPISVKEDINNTKAQAQAAYNAAEVDGEGVTAVIESLNTAIDEVVLNAPAEGQRFYIKVATEGHGKYGNAVLATLGATGDNNPTGYGLNANNEVKPYLNQAFIFTQVEGNLYNISIERTEGTVYLTYGELNGSAAGWNKQQIQATTDAEKKGEFKIVPTGKNGVLKILNIIDNNFIDCQNEGSIYTDTKLSAEEFAFELAAEAQITLTIPEEGWTTWILPFNAELPEDVKAYSCSEINGDKLTLVEAESLKANTPYLVNYSYESDYGFTGYGLADKDSYTDGLFTGTYVEYQTTANSNTYVLQNINSEVAFYLVGEDEQPTVDAYSCYITCEAQEDEEQVAMFLLPRGQEDDPNAVEGAERKALGAVVVYDLMGRKVSSMEKGNMYIVNGVKVIIK